MRPTKRNARSYKEWISRSSQNRETRIVLALDVDDGTREGLLERSERLLKRTISSVCAVKLGRQTVLNLGARGTKRLTRIVHENDIPCIIDDKINDIGETNRAIAEAYFRMGFDGLTANPFTGWRGGLEPLFQLAHQRHHGVILLTYMSHPGASEGYGQKVVAKGKRTPESQYRLFANDAVRWGADGAVVGATRPNVIREVKSILRDKVPIYSPGVGAQGGRLADSSRAGTDYFIIGRSITRSPRPEETALEYARESVSLD